MKKILKLMLLIILIIGGITMSEKIYGICENKCLKEVYSKEETYNKTEVDTKLTTCKLNGDFVVLQTTLNQYGEQVINYPTGFNKNNTIILSLLRKTSDGESTSGNTNWAFGFASESGYTYSNAQVYLRDNNISIEAGIKYTEHKLTIMKV